MLFLFLACLKEANKYNPDSTFCVCQDSQEISCKNICQNYQQLKFSQKSLKRSLKLVKGSKITFLIFGTNEIQPDFNLTTFEKYSFNIIAPNEKESIILYPGKAISGVLHKFKNVNIKLKNGVYSFYKLQLSHSSIDQYSEKDVCEIEQDYLDIDYYSLNAISEQIYLYPPSNGVKLYCQSYVNKIQFLNDQKIVFGNDTSNFLDFSQIEKSGNSTIILSSNEITFTFSELPKSYDFFPKITFVLKRSCTVYIDEEQFPEEIMELQKYITFSHADRTVYIQSRSGTNPPQFNLVGTGKALYNNKEIKFFSSYCLCEGQNCAKMCLKNEIVKFNETDSTVVGNPISSISYMISGSSADKMPTFDSEHFLKKNLTIFGASKSEHIKIKGDSTETLDYGSYKLSGIIIHSTDNFLFHNAFLSNVDFEVDRKSENFESHFKSMRLNIDINSLINLYNKSIKLLPSPLGIGIHTTNLIKDELKVEILSSSTIAIQNINIPVPEQSTISIFCGGTISILNTNSASMKLSQFPKINIHSTGDMNTINFEGNWPKEFTDISSKITVFHGGNPLYVQGEYDGSRYKFNPPIIDHDGIGPIFFNGVLSSYKDTFCVCQGIDCTDLCDGEMPINFSKEAISSTVVNNPTRAIEFVVKNSDSKNFPIFNLSDFAFKSFTVKSNDKKGRIGLLPQKSNVDPAISHYFKGIKIFLMEDAKYTFGTLDLDKVTIQKYSNMHQNTLVCQSSIYADLYSVQSLFNNELLTPCDSLVTINGGLKFERIEIKKNQIVSLCTHNSCIDFDISKIHNSIPMFTTLFGSTERLPFRFILHKNAEIPRIQIGVNKVDNGNAYIQFEGSDFTNQNHVLSEKIFINHGFNNIHLMTPFEDGSFIGYPPHVTLIGDADYYVNEVKQVSSRVDYYHPINNDNAKNPNQNHSLLYVCIAFVIFIIFIASYLNIKRIKRNNIDKMPAMLIARNYDAEDDPHAPFFDVEDNTY